MSFDPRESLRLALNPRSIAIVGASENPNKIGGRPIAFLSRFGFKGPVYPVNPAREQVQGHRSYTSLAALPATPDLAVIAVPGEMAVQAVDECAAIGVRVAIVMASGFGETADPHAHALERAMVKRARSVGMRLVGPNSQGLANFGNGAVPNFSTMFLDTPALDGPVGIISQSGAMSVIPYGLLRGRGIGVRYAHATGNDADITACELATVVVEDPDLKLLLLYLEGLPDPWHLAQAAKTARKAGRSIAGKAAAQSHTGALATEDRVVDAFLEDLGIWRAQGMADLIDSVELYLKGWKPRGRRLVAISNSGAVCVMTADAASDAGMPLEPLADHTQAGLRKILPGFATTRNPVDLTAALLSNSRLFSDILPVIAPDPAADAFLIGIAVAGTGYDVEAFARDTAAFAQQTGKPLVAAASQPAIAEQFKAQGIAVFPTEGQAIRSLSQFLAHDERLRVAREANLPILQAPASELHSNHDDAQASAHLPDLVGEHHMPVGGVLRNEVHSLAMLGQRGVTVVPHRLCQNEAAARAAFDALGGAPVVVKACSAGVTHKSELGLVRVGIADGDGVARAFREISAAAARANVVLDGVIVANLIKGSRELMIGAHRDPIFGPVLLVGDGGRNVEVMPDLAMILAPFTVERIERALRRLRVAALFDGVRGDPPMDIAAFCQSAAAVGALITDPEARVLSLDLNPVIVGEQGAGCVAVDAVVFVDEGIPR
ncbi:MAG: CoA-binding protein [Betaproteobacteria bacterium]|nr:CoA-binding protein [Betaproteobacteria bacterium]